MKIILLTLILAASSASAQEFRIGMSRSSVIGAAEKNHLNLGQISPQSEVLNYSNVLKFGMRGSQIIRFKGDSVVLSRWIMQRGSDTDFNLIVSRVRRELGKESSSSGDGHERVWTTNTWDALLAHFDSERIVYEQHYIGLGL